METTAEPIYASVEHFAGIIRENSDSPAHTGISAIGIIRAVIGDTGSSEAEKVAWIRNALVALDKVRDELAKAHR